jgi:hypothetical protein
LCLAPDLPGVKRELRRQDERHLWLGWVYYPAITPGLLPGQRLRAFEDLELVGETNDNIEIIPGKMILKF